MTTQSNKVRVAGLCVAALVAAVAVTRADDTNQMAPMTMDQMMDKIRTLEKKVSDLEGVSTQVVMQSSIPSKTLDFLGQVEMSGFVSASYIYDFSRPSGASQIAGRGFDVNNNSFTLNKFKLAFEKPVTQSATNWNAGFRTDLIVGQDAPLTHSSGMFGGSSFGTPGGSTDDIDLEQAFVDFNIPIGNGIKVMFGKMVTLMGVEVIEEVSNPNLSVGNQFLYEENFTQTGLELVYQLTPKVDVEVAVFNGWDTLPDNNSSKSFMGRIGIVPDDKTTIGLLGYGGCEEANDNRDYRTGAEIVLNRKWTDKLTTWLQGDYGHEDNAPVLDTPGATANADWYGIGGWITYDFTDKIELALRHDWIKDGKDARTPVNTMGTTTFVAAPASFSSRPKTLESLTLTLNYKPVTNLQLRPELRYDHSQSSTALNGKQDQITAAFGVAYLF